MKWFDRILTALRSAARDLISEDDEIESPHWLSDPSETPEQRAERAELGRALQHCLGDLPEEFRAVVALVDVGSARGRVRGADRVYQPGG